MSKGHDKGHKGQMSDREAMKLALEALENWMRIDTVEDMHIFEMVTAPESITALRQALEQPECAECDGMGFRDGVGDKCKKCGGEGAEPWDATDMAHRAGGLSVEQGPVAFLYKYRDGWTTQLRFDGSKPLETKKLYAAPPKREWVGLTDEEIEYIWGIAKPDYEDIFDFPRAIEAKLREKNGF